MVFHNFAPLAVYETELPGFLPDIYKSYDDHKFTTESGQVTGELAGKVLVHQDKRLHNFYRAIGRKTREYLRSFDQFVFLCSIRLRLKLSSLLINLQMDLRNITSNDD